MFFIVWQISGMYHCSELKQNYLSMKWHVPTSLFAIGQCEKLSSNSLKKSSIGIFFTIDMDLITDPDRYLFFPP